jgi:hypothetical protein
VVKLDAKRIDKALATPILSEPTQEARRPNRKPKSTLSLAYTRLVCRLFTLRHG